MEALAAAIEFPKKSPIAGHDALYTAAPWMADDSSSTISRHVTCFGISHVSAHGYRRRLARGARVRETHVLDVVLVDLRMPEEDGQCSCESSEVTNSGMAQCLCFHHGER